MAFSRHPTSPFSLLLAALPLLLACAPVSRLSAPAGGAVRLLSDAAPAGPLAWSTDGRRLAFVQGGVRVLFLPRGPQQRWDRRTPRALAWAPAGKQLAAAFEQGKESLVARFGAPGRVLAAVRVPGRVTDLRWRGHKELLFLAVTMTRYSFGADRRVRLYHWTGQGKPRATLLDDATLKPLTLRRWGRLLERGSHLQLSPLQDEILYTRLHDPPAESPYWELVLRHLDTGRERSVARLGLESAGGRFTAGGAQVVYGDGGRQTRRIDPWLGRTVAVYPQAGRFLATGPAGELFVDGSLYRGRQLLARFPTGTRGYFAAGRKKVLLRLEGRIYLAAVPGLTRGRARPAPSPILLRLRRWRSLGLITPGECARQLRRFGQP